MSDYVTRAEHLAALARLDQADAELRKAQTDLERSIRHDYEGKIASAVSGLSTTIDLRFDNVDEELKKQSEVLFKPKFSLGDINGAYLWTIIFAGVATT